MILIDRAPLGEVVLDGALARIAEDGEGRSTGHWVDAFAAEYDTLQRELLNRLVARGVLARRDDKLLWLIGTRRYPIVDDVPRREVKRRIMDVLLSELIPDPRDIAIICLADACALWPGLIVERELARLKPRIAQVARLDLIGRSVAHTIRELQDATRGAEAKWLT